jgi:hypothetical protein
LFLVFINIANKGDEIMKIDHRLLSEKKKTGPKPKYTEGDIQQLKELKDQGYSQVSISKATGIPQRTVSTLLKK